MQMNSFCVRRQDKWRPTHIKIPQHVVLGFEHTTRRTMVSYFKVVETTIRHPMTSLSKSDFKKKFFTALNFFLVSRLMSVCSVPQFRAGFSKYREPGNERSLVLSINLIKLLRSLNPREPPLSSCEDNH